MTKKFVLGLAMMLIPALGMATTYYVDGGCLNDGNGTTTSCAASAGGAGAYNTLDSCRTRLTSGNTCELRGVHTTHGSNHATGTFDGRYFEGRFNASIDCSAGAACGLQSYGWTGIGTGEKVYLDGTRCPNPSTCTGSNCSYSITGDPAKCGVSGSAGAWQQCSWDGSACDCDAAHLNVQIGAGGSTACTQTWWTSDQGSSGSGFQNITATPPLWAQKPDGSPTFKISSASGNITQQLADMTNAHADYNANRCTNSILSSQTFIPCSTSSDCPSGETCTATSAEIDSLNDGTILLVRWGTGSAAPGTNPRPYISYHEFAGTIASAFGAMKNFFVKGITLRDHSKAAVDIESGSTNNTFIDDYIIFAQCGVGCDGGNRGFAIAGAQNTTITDNVIAYTTDEGIHQIGVTGGVATVSTISRNWIHHQGGISIVGHVGGTPSGILIGDDTATIDNGNFSGSVIDGNLIEYQGYDAGFSSPGPQIRLENSTSNLIIRNNVLRNGASGTGAPCLVVCGGCGGSGTRQTDSNQVYNNLLLSCEYLGIDFECPSPGTCRNNLFFNNTIARSGTSAAELDCSNCGGTVTGNIFRNNLFWETKDQRQIRWTNTDSSNIFENNLVYNTTKAAANTTLITWLNTAYSCNTITSISATNACSDPKFSDIATSDYHIKSTSPARNAGTSTGMPASRTADINNTLAIFHGLPAYSDNTSIVASVWDIGVDEFTGSSLCDGVTCTPLDQCHVAGTCNPSTGLCDNPQKSDGTTCNDGNACTSGDVCTAGTCTPVSTTTCTASDQCHDAGTCDSATGLCSNPAKANGSVCNDTNACTQIDTCQTGVCTGSNPIVCAGDQCNNAGTCNPANGLCSATSPKTDGTSCSDSNLCTTGDTCQSGTCVGGATTTCTALDQCHNAGVCNASTGICSNPNKPTNTACNDGNACTRLDVCLSGVCVGSLPITCTILDQCHTLGTCNTSTGVCSNPVKPDGTACNDGNGATIEDVCTAGICAGVAAPGGDTGFESGSFGNGGATVEGGCTCSYGVASVTNTAPLRGTYSGKLLAYEDDAPTLDSNCNVANICTGMNWTWTGLTSGNRYRVKGLYQWHNIDTGNSGYRKLLVCTASDCTDLTNSTGEERNGIVCHTPPNCGTGIHKFSFVFTATNSSMTSKWLLVTAPGITNDYILLDDVTIIGY